MTKVMRLTVLATIAGALVGCGGAKIGSKEEAAKLAGTSGSKGQSSGGVLRLYQSAANGDGSFSSACTNGGTVSATVGSSTTNATGGLVLNLKYDGCVEPSYDDPETEAVEKEDVVYDGELVTTMSFDFTNTTAGFEITLKGRIDLSGAYNDFIEMNLTETFLTTTSGSTATMQFVIDGTVNTSSESYTYQNETYTITAEGKIEPQA